MSSIYETILQAVASEIQGLGLTDIPSTSVVVGKVPTDRKDLLQTIPGIVVTPWGDSLEVGGSNVSDDIGYPVFIAMIQKSNTSQSENRDRALQWSESIVKKFRNKRLAGVSTTYICRVKRDSKFDPSMFFSANVDVNTILLSFENRELRE